MNQQDVKVSFYLKKNEANAEGKCPVMARLNVGRYSEMAFSVKMLIPYTMWTSGRATGKSAAAREINNRLDEIRATAFSVFTELSAIRDIVKAEDVKSRILGMAASQDTLMNYYKAFIERFEKRVGINRCAGSAVAYWYAYNNLSRYLKDVYNLSDLPFTALDRSFIDRFDLYLRTERHLASGTIVLLTRKLVGIVMEAIADGIITSNPFMGFSSELPKRAQKYLNSEELKRLMTTPLPKNKLYVIRDLFLFSCYTGISYGDMHLLTNDDLSIAEDGEVWIKTARKKTKVEYEIPLLEIPLHILRKYEGLASDNKLLPMYDNSTLNRNLKTIAKICGINRPLVFHAARHCGFYFLLKFNILQNFSA